MILILIIIIIIIIAYTTHYQDSDLELEDRLTHNIIVDLEIPVMVGEKAID